MNEHHDQNTPDKQSMTENIRDGTTTVPGQWTYREIAPDEMPPMGIEPHELVHLDLSRLPRGVRLFVKDPWADTKITRQDDTLHVTTAVKVQPPDKTWGDRNKTIPHAESAMQLKWQARFPDSTDTEEILKAIEDGRESLRLQAERIGGRAEPAGESTEVELLPPNFPVDLRPRPPRRTVTMSEFLACDLAALPDLAQLLVEESEPPFIPGRIGDHIAALAVRFDPMPTRKHEYRGKVLGVMYDGKRLGHGLLEDVDSKLGTAAATHVGVYMQLALVFPLSITPAEVCGAVNKHWQEMLEYVAALIG